jgi:catechol 2,3-dioxygenase
MKPDSADRRPFGIAPPGYRLPDDAHVGAVRLQVSDLHRSITYYERVIGLRVTARATDRADLAAHGDDRTLVSLHSKSGISPAPRRGAFGLYHFALLVPDRAELGRFAAHLASIDERVGMADHLVSEALYLWDPDSLGIEVYADRPRHLWEQDGRQLVMATDPLDVPSLVSAGGRRAWRGMPAGTTVGHVHLHVGDLEDAEAFYHRALGFDKTVWNYPGALFLAAGGYHHHLGTNTWSPGPSARPDEAQLLEWELVVPRREDVSAAAHSLRDSGYSVNDTDCGSVAADPWGTHLRVVPLA